MRKKIITSCPARFHIFNQAEELYSHHLLHKLITAYPKSKIDGWNFPKESIISLPMFGLLNYILNHSVPYLPFTIQSRARQWFHNTFDRSVSQNLENDFDVFIGLSSFALHNIKKAHNLGKIAIVDHGSLHQKIEKYILEKETEQYGFVTREGNWKHNWLIDKMDHEFEQADHIFAISHLAKQTMIDQGVSEKKIFVNYPGVDLSHFFPSVKQDNVFRIIFCGGITPLKGLHYLLKAFYELNLPKSELIIIGGGLANAQSDKHYNDLLLRYHRDNIKFVGTFPQHDLQKIYTRGSLFVLPSLADGFAMVIPQALACGLPVITTTMTGAAELIQNDYNGYVVPSGDIEALKERILYCYENPEKLNEMSDNAIRSVQQDFSWDVYGSRLSTFLETL